MHHSRNGFLTRAGYQLAQQLSLEGLAPRDVPEYIDSMVSVSENGRNVGMTIFDEGVIDEQYRRFLDPPGVI